MIWINSCWRIWKLLLYEALKKKIKMNPEQDETFLFRISFVFLIDALGYGFW